MDIITELMENIPFLVFFMTGTVAVASSILVVAMRNPVHSALFLMLSFLCVAILFFLVGAEFVGAVQILVYAGGIMVLFLFTVMLVNVRALSDEQMFSPYWRGAVVIGVAFFAVFAFVIRPGSFGDPVDDPAAFGRKHVKITQTVSGSDGQPRQVSRVETRSTNSEEIAMALYGDYVVPFEIVSIFLLVAMVGAIVIGKRELLGGQEETAEFIVDRARKEKEVKEASGA